MFDAHHAVLSAMGDQAVYIGSVGAGSIAKLVHNASSAAVRQGASGRNRMFDRLANHFLTGRYDPADFALRLLHADFALRLLHTDVFLACQLAREVQVPMRLTNMALMELTEALNRGWGARDSRVGSLLQQQRAGIPPVAVAPEKLKAVVASDAKETGRRQAARPCAVDRSPRPC